MAGVLGEEGGYDAECGVPEAADVQDVAAIRGVGRGVRLQVAANPAQRTPHIRPRNRRPSIGSH